MNVVYNVSKNNTEPLCWAVVEDLLITLNRPGTLTDQRLDELLTERNQKNFNWALGLSIGQVTLNSVQRKRSVDAFSNLTRVAVIVEDRLTRGIVTALGWLGLGNMKSFLWEDLEKAVEYLAVPNVPAATIVEAATRLQHLGLEGTDLQPRR